MYAIFEDGSHQFRVSEGDRVIVDRRQGDAGTEVVFPKCSAHHRPRSANIGAPVIEGATVHAKIVDQFRDKEDHRAEIPPP